MPTNYNTGCGGVGLSFIQMLASSIRGYHDLQGVIHYRLNAVEVADDCTMLSEPADCDTSHLDPERLLVENVFATDECSQLAIKLFSNGDNDWEDYSECGEIPKSFIELLARTIKTYSTNNMINAVIDSGVCASLTSLLDCTTNQIESERLLVANAFAVDDCGNFLIKFFANSNTMTDYNTGCAEEPQTFYQLLARTLVLYNGHYYINIASVDGACADIHPFWTCSNNHIDSERALVENLFATDSCGNLALKIYNNAEPE